MKEKHIAKHKMKINQIRSAEKAIDPISYRAVSSLSLSSHTHSDFFFIALSHCVIVRESIYAFVAQTHLSLTFPH